MLIAFLSMSSFMQRNIPYLCSNSFLKNSTRFEAINDEKILGSIILTKFFEQTSIFEYLSPYIHTFPCALRKLPNSSNLVIQSRFQVTLNEK